jgi:hypothetical protein
VAQANGASVGQVTTAASLAKTTTKESRQSNNNHDKQIKITTIKLKSKATQVINQDHRLRRPAIVMIFNSLRECK